MSDDLLTEDELEALRLIGQFAGKMRRIIGDGPQAEGDWREAADKIHQLQVTVMSQAASRAYPQFRLLGGHRVTPPEAEPEIMSRKP